MSILVTTHLTVTLNGFCIYTGGWVVPAADGGKIWLTVATHASWVTDPAIPASDENTVMDCPSKVKPGGRGAGNVYTLIYFPLAQITG